MLRPMIDWQALWKRRGLRSAILSLGAVLVLSAVGAGGYVLWPEPSPPPPPPAASTTTAEAQAFVGSDDFEKLPMDRKITWVEERMQKMTEMDPEEFRKSWEDMDEQTRRRIHENLMPVMEARMQREVDAYHRLPASEREAYLDKLIDQMERFRPRGPRMGDGPPGPGAPPPPGGPSGRGDRRGGPGRMMARMAKMPADRRARINTFMKTMAKRRAERGMGPPGGGPRR